jgi:tetratricopeptide (TPR) repeat protein
MRRFPALSVALALAVTPVLAAHPNAARAAAPAEDPAALYQEGHTQFRLGNYEAAVQNFTRSYAISKKALLLFNIGLAYRRWYGVSKEISHLRKAKEFFANFLAEIQRDPSLADPAEAEQQLKELESELKVAEDEQKEKERRQAEAAARQGGAGREGPVVPQGPDPGKKLKFGGIGAMAGGGVVAAVGFGLGAYFLLKGQEFEEELRGLNADLDSMGCGDPPVGTCADLQSRADTTEANGRKANSLALGTFVIGGLGVAALAVGGALFGVAAKKTKAWRRGETVRVTPGIAPGFAGVGISGRF